MNHTDEVAALRAEIESLRQSLDRTNRSTSKAIESLIKVVRLNSRAIARQPSFVDALLDGPAGIRTREMTATEEMMRQRIQRARLYRKEDDQ